MMAMVSAVAARVGESAFARWCGVAGDVLDCVIPLVLLAAIIAAFAADWLGYLPAG